MENNPNMENYEQTQEISSNYCLFIYTPSLLSLTFFETNPQFAND